MDSNSNSQQDSLSKLTILIHQDGSLTLDPAIPLDEASKWLGWFLELCQVVTEQPELALDIFNLPRARSSEP